MRPVYYLGLFYVSLCAVLLLRTPSPTITVLEHPVTPEAISFDGSGVAWFQNVRASCNPVEVETIHRFKPPPSTDEAADGTRGTLSLPFATGGANWEGGAYDPGTGLLFVPSQTMVGNMSLTHDPEASDIRYISGVSAPPKVLGIPVAKPPWGRITAIDLESGEHQWMIANGDTPDHIASNPALTGVDLPRTGKATRAGILVTDTLLFAGEGFGGDPVFRAHRKDDGVIVAEITLPATQASPPSTYRVNGRQFIVMTVADGESPAELIALALPTRN